MVILPKDPRSLGESLGQGLGSGIEKIAQMKLNQIQQQHERGRLAQSYSKIPGITPEQGYLLADMPEQHRMNILQDLVDRNKEDQWRQSQMQEPQYQQQPQQQSGSSTSGFQPSGFQNFMGQRQVQPQGFQPSGFQSQMQQPGMQKQRFMSPQLAWQQQKFQQQSMQNLQKEQRGAQKNIEARYAKYIDQAASEASNAEQLKASVIRAKELIQSGKTRSGMGGLLPLSLTNANEETRSLDKIFNEIILQRGNMGKGVASRMKLQLAAAAKPSLDMPKSAQLRILDDMLEDSEKTINATSIIDEIIDANGGEVPNGLNRIATRAYHDRYSGKVDQQGSIVDQSTSKSYNADNEDIVDQAMRLGVGTASRILPKVATGPGDVLGLGASAVDYVGSKFGKELGAKEAVEKYSPLPTSESVEKRISKWTNGYTDPKGPVEQFGYNVADIFGSFLMPQAAAGKVAQLIGKTGATGKTATAAKNIILPFSGYVGSKKRLLAQAASGEAAKEIISNLGGGPALQTAAQVGGFLLAGTAGTRAKLTKDTTALFNEVKKESKGIDVNVSRAIPKLEKIAANAEASASPYKAEVNKIVNDAVEAMKKDPENFSLNNIIGQIQSVNDRFAMSTEQRVSGEIFTPKSLRPYLHDVRQVLNETVEEAGKLSPEAKTVADKYAVANDNWRGLNTNGKATQWMMDNTEQFGHGSTKHHFVFNLLRGGLSYLGRDIGKVKNLLSNPSGQKAYLEAIEAASAGNMSKFKRAYDRLVAMVR